MSGVNDRRLTKRPLYVADILKWAEVYHAAMGRWPTKEAGDIPGTFGESWLGVDRALRAGLRGLPGGSSLAQLMAGEHGARNVQDLPALSEEQILAWADEYQRQNGCWPTGKSGTIAGTGGEKWSAINQALYRGVRGLAGGSSLARLLAARRGVRNRKSLPPFSEERILAWADAHHRRTDSWPGARSGPIPETPGETWMAVEMALSHGQRGLPGGSSLALLLAVRRGVRNIWTLPTLTVDKILAWADAFRQRSGRWPHEGSGVIPESDGDTWLAVNQALKRGGRGLPGRTSLAKLLAVERGVRNHLAVPRLTRKQILAWADAHHRRTGAWPTRDAGAIAEAAGESWSAVNAALERGLRGLRGGSSLAGLLARHRDCPYHGSLPPLSKKKIVRWADAHFQRTGKWPNINSGPVHGAPEERWDRIDNALRQGGRGLGGDSSLLRLLAKKRGVRDPLHLPPLDDAQIIRWAEVHFQRHGAWPKLKSGSIADAPGETWGAVDFALRLGRRGLCGGRSLAKLLADHRTRQPLHDQRYAALVPPP